MKIPASRAHEGVSLHDTTQTARAPTRQPPGPAMPRPAPSTALLAIQRMMQEGAPRREQTSVRAANTTGLPDALKSSVEGLSGVSLDGVRVHYNSDKPALIQALAYTHGSEIHVAPGQERHVPHEAWHLVQQAQGRVTPMLQVRGVGVNDDARLEREADEMGEMACGVHQEAGAGLAEPAAASQSGVGAVQRKIMNGGKRIMNGQTWTGKIDGGTETTAEDVLKRMIQLRDFPVIPKGSFYWISIQNTIASYVNDESLYSEEEVIGAVRATLDARKRERDATRLYLKLQEGNDDDHMVRTNKRAVNDYVEYLLNEHEETIQEENKRLASVDPSKLQNEAVKEALSLTKGDQHPSSMQDSINEMVPDVVEEAVKKGYNIKNEKILKILYYIAVHRASGLGSGGHTSQMSLLENNYGTYVSKRSPPK